MTLSVFGDFGFGAGSDETANPYQDAQRCINFYPEVSPSRGAKMPVALLGTPGLVQVGAAPGGGVPSYTADNQVLTADAGSFGLNAWNPPSLVTNLPVRGMWVLPGYTSALAVIGNTCYLVTEVASGSRGTPGTVGLQAVGQLASNAGPVVIRDNDIGGYAVLVDGPNGYLYNIATSTFSQITDPAWLGSDTVAYIDGWWIFNQPGTQTFYTNYPQYGTGFSGSYFALKDAASDKLIAVIENKEELWLLGERTTEIWYDAGGAFFPFERLVGTLLQTGCKAPYSVAQISQGGDDSLIWLGRNVQGENVIVRTSGFSWQVVSTPAVSDSIASFATSSDAVGYVYQEDTHVFYVLSFPSADRTWVYDATLPPELAWHERLSYDPYAAQWHRHRSNCFMNFAGMRIVGDYQNGALYQMTRAAYSDAGWPLRAVRRSPYVWNAQNRERVFMQSLQVDFRLGQGNASGLGTNPQAKLRISRDYGATYGAPRLAPMGSMGQYTNRCIWRRLGWSRGAVLEVEVMDPVNRDIAGVTLKAAGP